MLKPSHLGCPFCVNIPIEDCDWRPDADYDWDGLHLCKDCGSNASWRCYTEPGWFCLYHGDWTVNAKGGKR